jgi:hypothetical protein
MHVGFKKHSVTGQVDPFVSHQAVLSTTALEAVYDFAILH